MIDSLRNSNAAYVLLGTPEDIRVGDNMDRCLNDESAEGLVSYLASDLI